MYPIQINEFRWVPALCPWVALGCTTEGEPRTLQALAFSLGKESKILKRLTNKIGHDAHRESSGGKVPWRVRFWDGEAEPNVQIGWPADFRLRLQGPRVFKAALTTPKPLPGHWCRIIHWTLKERKYATFSSRCVNRGGRWCSGALNSTPCFTATFGLINWDIMKLQQDKRSEMLYKVKMFCVDPKKSSL